MACGIWACVCFFSASLMLYYSNMFDFCLIPKKSKMIISTFGISDVTRNEV